MREIPKGVRVAEAQAQTASPRAEATVGRDP